MKQTPEQMALQHSLALCQGHADALQDALQDIHARAMDVNDYTTLSKQDRRLLDQFAYRYGDAMMGFRACKFQTHLKFCA
jgi:hypothetical protein